LSSSVRLCPNVTQIQLHQLLPGLAARGLLLLLLLLGLAGLLLHHYVQGPQHIAGSCQLCAMRLGLYRHSLRSQECCTTRASGICSKCLALPNHWPFNLHCACALLIPSLLRLLAASAPLLLLAIAWGHV
jgi:hypothetical protein